MSDSIVLELCIGHKQLQLDVANSKNIKNPNITDHTGEAQPNMPSNTALIPILISAIALPLTRGAAFSKPLNSALFKREGMNCQGSSECWYSGGFVQGNLSTLQGLVSGAQDDYLYNNGQRIACLDDGEGEGICLFLQMTTGGVLGGDVKVLLQDLIDHGCTKCGSIPTGLPAGINDVSRGELTANYVTSTGGCNGLCST